jgi:hypothetical protein
MALRATADKIKKGASRLCLRKYLAQQEFT